MRSIKLFSVVIHSEETIISWNFPNCLPKHLCATVFRLRYVHLAPWIASQSPQTTRLGNNYSRLEQQRQPGLKNGGHVCWNFLNDLYFTLLKNVYLSKKNLFICPSLYTNLLLYTQICLFLQSHHFLQSFLMSYLFTLYNIKPFHEHPVTHTIPYNPKIWEVVTPQLPGLTHMD